MAKGIGDLIDGRAHEIMMKGYNREPVSKEECEYLLSFRDCSPEMSIARTLANDLVRKGCGNTAIMAAQIGVQIGPCPADCAFCSFNASRTSFQEYMMSEEELADKVRKLTEHNDVCSIFLMTMHRYDLDHLKRMIKLVRGMVPRQVRISLNIGDVDLDAAVELKKAGADTAYHVCRLREGKDSKLNPDDRIRSMKNLFEAGFAVSTCVEPIGPEHTASEMIDRFFLGMEMNCFNVGVMKRVSVPGTPLARYGSISDSRMTQISSVFSLACAHKKKTPAVNVHESCPLGLHSSSNLIIAEYGGNPRDLSRNTEANRGLTTGEARTMFFEAGFTNILLSDGTRARLDRDYLIRTDSLI